MKEFAPMVEIPLMITDFDVDAVAESFLCSPYSGPKYVDWSLDRRIDTFLRRHGFSWIADDGDVSSTVLYRIMSFGGRQTTA
jgi:hypothetical protein